MGSTAWQVVGVEANGELIWKQGTVKFWDLLLYGEGTKSDLYEQWDSLIWKQKYDKDFDDPGAL